jgi:hypothetical protein
MSNIRVTNARPQTLVLHLRTGLFEVLETIIPPGATQVLVAPPGGFNGDQLPIAVAACQSMGLTDGSVGPAGPAGAYLVT